MLFRLWNVDKKSFIARNRIIGGDERTFNNASNEGPRWIKKYFSSRAESSCAVFWTFPELLKNFNFSECSNWESFSFIFHQNFFQCNDSIALYTSCFPNFSKSPLPNFCHSLVFCRFVWTIFKSAFQVATTLTATLVRIWTTLTGPKMGKIACDSLQRL